MPNMEELINKILVEITRNRTVQLFISKIDMDYAYGQMELSEQKSRQCVFAITGRNVSGYYKQKNCRPCRYTLKFQKMTEHSDIAHRLS